LAFLEETAWLLARFRNVYVNMEIQNLILERRPRAFAAILLGLINVGGHGLLKRLFWGSGTTLYHPRPGLEAFAEFEFPEDMLEGAGLFSPVHQLTAADKRGILGGNYARLHGLDVAAAQQAIADDEFAGELAEPYTTISVSGEVSDWQAARA